ncbi:hypothetical protein RQP46_009007 [Phenoliferia psychrophenolica]
MAAFISNRFAALDEDSPAPAPAAKKAPAAAAPAPAAAKAAPAKRTENAGRGGQRKVYQGDREVNADAPQGGDKEDRAASRGGRGGARGGARGGRGGANPRSNGGTYLGGDRPRRENGGGRPFDRQSQTGHKDTDKATEAGWGAETGAQELAAEVAGAEDAKAAATPTGDGSATPTETRAPRERRERAPRDERVEEEEEEDNTQTYDEYLALQAAKKLGLAQLPAARVANEGADEDQWKNAVAIARKGEAEEEWFLGTKKTDTAGKSKKVKDTKTYIEIETSYKPPKRDGPPRDSAPRGGARGRGEGRGRGGARGGAPGAPRGAPRSSAAPVNVSDAAAFPALA